MGVSSSDVEIMRINVPKVRDPRTVEIVEKLGNAVDDEKTNAVRALGDANVGFLRDQLVNHVLNVRVRFDNFSCGRGGRGAGPRGRYSEEGRAKKRRNTGVNDQLVGLRTIAYCNLFISHFELNTGQHFGPDVAYL